MVPTPTARASVPTAINDFTVLPLTLPPLPSFPEEATHYLHLRAHAPKVPTEDTPRQLFLVNVPIDATDSHLRSLFAEQLGGARTEDVAFEETRRAKGITAPVAPSRNSRKRKRGPDSQDAEGPEVGQLPEVWDRPLHRSGSTAVVTFVDKPSADLVLREARWAAKTGKTISWPGSAERTAPPLGHARYLTHHALRYPDPALLQSSVDAYMSAFSAREAAHAKERARLASIPDADGFITVTRGAKVAPKGEEGGGEEAKEERARKRDKKEKKRIGEDFYRFQVREKRKEVQLGLVRGFEEDARRVEEMRRRRGRVRPE